MQDLTILFYFIDNFCKTVGNSIKNIEDYDKKKDCDKKINNKASKSTRTANLSNSEILTILLFYYQSPCDNFKNFYIYYLQKFYSKDFKLVSYNRFLTLQKRVLELLILLLQWYLSQAEHTGIAYIDSSKLSVCKNKRISQHKVFGGLAERGKSSMGWFYGFKLHMIINEKGEIHDIEITAGNTDDRAAIPNLIGHLKGLLFGDKGYLGQELFEKLYSKGIKLVTGIKKNMKNKLMPIEEKIYLRKRSIIETVFGVLKNSLDLEHSRHRSVTNYFMHIIAVIVTYCMKDNKPSIKYEVKI